ncbi:hypothetical protein LCGC14_2084290 [marine sediment metagenome]|uniref:quinolinate synthase n=1 Tax=marine sediment metagenome TaxID=412755 RepID=A0A0F9EEW3_9ZZZZ
MEKSGDADLVEKITHLKEEKDAVILVHNYQRGEIQDIADFLGDTLVLSRQAEELTCKMIVFCGVRFMAETAKIISPDKVVLLPRKEASCPMANMINKEELQKMKIKYPEARVVSYVNTTAEIKAESDACCTSANAIAVVQNIDAERVIFVPDKNLANYVSRFTDKEVIPYNGYCYVHVRIRAEDIKKAKKIHPDAVVFVHPECPPEVIELADEVASTGGMLKLARASEAKKLIIGTEEGLIYRLKKENPEKKFFAAGPALICRNMKLTRLEDVYLSLKEERYKVEIEGNIASRAKKALNEMLKYA